MTLQYGIGGLVRSGHLDSSPYNAWGYSYMPQTIGLHSEVSPTLDTGIFDIQLIKDYFNIMA